MLKIIIFFFIASTILTTPVFAASDPRLKPNNKVGINILSPDAEIEEASQLVNTNGDWGWIVIIIKKNERNLDRWQSVLNLAAKNHLIPIIRLATEFDPQGYWQRPTDEDAQSWADFLSKLYFPTENRYVQIYNEVNRASEWGGNVDAADYAKELAKTIDALKAKNSDFFVLNAPFDLSLTNSQTSLDPATFYQTMESTVPGIFDKLDGLASHSYPNPNFSTSPYNLGKTSISGFTWELNQIAKYTSKNDLPVFITETGWKRKSSGEDGLSEGLISKYYQIAFEKIWNDQRVVAVAPFVLDYPQDLFHKFSFKILGESSPGRYYDYFFTIRDLEKVKGEPERENIISQLQIKSPDHVLEKSKSEISLTFKNTGNYIWNPNENLNLKVISEQANLQDSSWNSNEIYPGQDAQVIVKITTKTHGSIPVTLQLAYENNLLAQREIEIKSETSIQYLYQGLKSFLKHIPT